MQPKLLTEPALQALIQRTRAVRVREDRIGATGFRYVYKTASGEGIVVTSTERPGVVRALLLQTCPC